MSPRKLTNLFTFIIVFAIIGCQPIPDTSDTQQAKDTSEVDRLLLKDFRPKSVFNVPQTHVEKAKFPAIDFHSHPYGESPEEVDAWVRVMKETGIEKSVILSYATGTRFDSIYQAYAGRYPEQFIIYCGFDYSGYDKPGYGPAAVAELQRCFDVGARGVGELGDKGKGLFYSKPAAYGMHIDDERMKPLIQKCGELNMPISIHVAEPIWMYMPMDSVNDGLINAFTWRLDNQKGILQHDETVGTLGNAVRDNPGTTFIACHYANCSYDLGILGNLFDQYDNLYADISARYGETAPIPRAVRRFFEAYPDRLLYGTDMGTARSMYEITFRILETDDEHFYDRENFDYHWPLHGYDLPDEVLEKVYSLNARKILASAK